MSSFRGGVFLGCVGCVCCCVCELGWGVWGVLGWGGGGREKVVGVGCFLGVPPPPNPIPIKRLPHPAPITQQTRGPSADQLRAPGVLFVRVVCGFFLL